MQGLLWQQGSCWLAFLCSNGAVHSLGCLASLCYSLTNLGDRSGETFYMYTNSCFVIRGQLFLMTQATDEPNQETQVSRYINQGQYVKGA
jgi:hypothetical protein